MKEKRTVRAIQAVNDALSHLGEEFAFAEAKNHLYNALKCLTKIDIKNKSIIKNYTKSFKEEAMQNNAKWHQLLLDGIAKLSDSNSGTSQIGSDPS